MRATSIAAATPVRPHGNTNTNASATFARPAPMAIAASGR